MTYSLNESIIVIDWGSTSFRAHLLNPEGQIVETREASLGVTQIDLEFRHVLPRNSRVAQSSIIACGMIGSSVGAIETDYCETPVGLSQLTNSLVDAGSMFGRPMWIIPGVCTTRSNVRDVIRGEETIAIGATGLFQHAERFMLCLPGTHSKWLQLNKGQIKHFETHITGELYASLPNMPLLSKSIASSPSSPHLTEPAFKRGLEQAKSHPNLLHNLFTLRCHVLSKDITPMEGAAYASGVLIGTELVHAPIAGSDTPILLLSDGQLLNLYTTALETLYPLNPVVTLSAQDALLAGAREIWRQKCQQN